MRSRKLGLAPWLLFAPLACEQDGVHIPACVELDFDVDDCAPLYQPTFENIYDNMLDPACAPAGSSCHANADASGAENSGLMFPDIDTAHDTLMGTSDGRPFLDPEDPSCSLLLVRLGSDDEDIRMPPGEAPRKDAELCAIAKWMAEGAAR